MSGMGNLYITQSEGHSLVIEAEDNILPVISTSVKNGVLIIDMSGRCIRNTKPINIYVSMKEVIKLSVSGSGNITGKNQIISDDLEVRVSGSGKSNLRVSAKQLKSFISGSGSAHFTGTAVSHTVEISGSGDIKAYGLKTETSTIEISGSGKSDVYVSKELNVKISGFGTVNYKGNPARVNQEISGSGKLKKVE